MKVAWCKSSAVRLYSGETVEVTHLSPVRFIRPTLALNSAQAIDLGVMSPGEGSKPSPPITIANGQSKTTQGGNQTFATILYGAANITSPSDKKIAWQQETDHTGVVLIGKDAKLFELVGTHVTKDSNSLKLIGQDGEPGLTGGAKPESEVVSVQFRGAPTPGRYSAVLRVVTQAGNLGRRSEGKKGEPLQGLYYVDIPVTSEVRD
jgi:hypothetical protein